MATEKRTEKTLEQIFSEKLAAAQAKDKLVKGGKDLSSGAGANLTKESSDYTKYLNELATSVSRNKDRPQQTTVQELNQENITKSDEINESSQPLVKTTVDDNNHESLSEIMVYQQIIDSLRSELSEYKSKLDSIQPEII